LYERRRPVTRFAVVIALFAALALESCYCYRAVSTDRRHVLYRSVPAGGRSLAAQFHVAARKVLARKSGHSPVAVINNRGVDLALDGRYGQAEILFREVLAEDALDPAAHNNLAVMYEMTGNREGAFRMYMVACRLEPDNEIFRKNFHDFAGYGGGKD
jgi:hypothetical protein